MNILSLGGLVHDGFVKGFLLDTDNYRQKLQTSPWCQSVLAVGVLTLIHVFTFFNHYFNGYIFPWDFAQGYHALVYAYLNNPAFPLMGAWQPHGSYGYPQHLALQNGSFYPPFLLLPLLKITYSHVVAAVMQSLHVLFGAIGMFVLARTRGFPVVIALLASTIFHFSAGFYSNAQHCDIVRGTAYIPWIFWLLDSRFAITNQVFVPLASFLFFCFFTGSYPGIIVATICCSLPYYFAQNAMLKTWTRRFLYSGKLFCALCISGLMVTIKYLPAAFLSSEIQLVQSSIDHGRGGLPHFVTAVFDFQSAAIPYDITMRSLYFGPVILIGLLYINSDTIKSNLDVVAALVLAAVMITLNPVSDFLIATLPGLDGSRFLLSDYRGIFHVMLILLLLGGMRVDSIATDSGFWIRLVIVYLSLGFLALYAIKLDAIGTPLYVVAVFLTPLIIVLASVTFQDKNGILSLGHLGGLCIILSSLTGILYWQNAQVWQLPNFYAEAKQRWGFDFEEFYAKHEAKQSAEPLAQRPIRLSYAHHHDFGIRGYYTGEFSDLAYDPGLRLKRNIRLLTLSRSIPELKTFLNSASRCFVMRPTADDRRIGDISLLKQEEEDGVFVKFLAFRQGGSRFFVRTPVAVNLVENEIFFPRWEATLTPVWTNADNSQITVRAMEGPWGLRAWSIPPGDFFVDTFFSPRFLYLSRVLSGIGIFLFLVSVGHAACRYAKKC